MHLSAGTMLRLGSMFHATGASGMTYYLYPYQYPASTSKSMQPARHPASQLGRERERELGRGTAGRGVKFTLPPNSAISTPYHPSHITFPRGSFRDRTAGTQYRPNELTPLNIASKLSAFLIPSALERP
jgi:hypothetical protein